MNRRIQCKSNKEISYRQLRRRINENSVRLLDAIAVDHQHSNVNHDSSTNNTIYSKIDSSVPIGEIHNSINLVDIFHSPANGNVDRNDSFVFSSIPHNKDECHNNSSDNIKSQLINWAISERINTNSVDKLLKILKVHHPDLPSCYRSLTATPRTTIVKEVSNGQYLHFGLKLGLITFLQRFKTFHLKNSTIDLMVNIDGLPIAKSSLNQLWPILGSIFKINYVFVIGIYHSLDKKPTDIELFLEDFIKEANELIENGLNYDGMLIKFNIKMICADSPAKAMILKIKGHTGYYSCTKCNVKGNRMDQRTYFPSYVGDKRTDQTFADHIDNNFHLGISPLEQISGLGLVSNIPLDYQHLICLGVVKKLIHLWCTGDLKYRLSFRNRQVISSTLINIRNNVPIEFARKPRSFKFYTHYKATEFRQFLLYTGYVLKSVLKPEIYHHFMTLHVAISILCSPLKCTVYLDYAQQLLKHFVLSYKIIYGEQHISYNVHGLLHICDDVINFGPLDNFSCFKFENYMTQLKKLIHKYDKPLQQIDRRLHEINKNKINQDHCTVSDNNIKFSVIYCNGPVLQHCTEPMFKKLEIKNFILIAGDKKNNCCRLLNGNIIRIQNFAYHVQMKCHVIIGDEFLCKRDLYSTPCPSSMLNIFKVKSLSGPKVWNINKIDCKYFIYQTNNNSPWWIAFPILHTELNERPTI